MKISLNKNALLDTLKRVINVIEHKNIVHVLSHVHLNAEGQTLSLTASDGTIQISSNMALEQSMVSPMQMTLPGRKLMDICRSLPDGSIMHINLERDWAILTASHSRFKLATLNPTSFPLIQTHDPLVQIEVPESQLRFLIERTHFAVAHNNFRAFLNAMLLEINKNQLTAFATDAHRLAFNRVALSATLSEPVRLLVQKKALLELMHLLQNQEDPLTLSVTKNHLIIQCARFSFIAGLLNTEYPDYYRLLKKPNDKQVIIEHDRFKKALNRASILANETLRTVRLQLDQQLLRLWAHNPEQENSEDTIAVDYHGAELTISFNINYLIDVLSVLKTDHIQLSFGGAQEQCLIQEVDSEHNSLFFIMPVEL